MGEKENLIINDKEYMYFLNRTHIFKLSRILEKIGLKPSISGMTMDIEIGIELFNQIFSKLHYAEKESLDFIASIYRIEGKEVEEIGFHNEFLLWKNIFDNEMDFFSKLFPSKKKEKEKSSNSTLSIPDTTAQN